MKKKKKMILIILLVLFLIACFVGIYMRFFRRSNNPSLPVVEVKVMNEISGYGYKLDDRDSQLFKETFNKLKELLEQESYDEKEYASLVSQLFIIDLYTIDNKVSKYDVGGVEYMYEHARDSFKSVVMDSIYKTVINNLDNNRKQSLPVVSSITVGEITENTYTMLDDSKVSSYKVPLEWTYEADLGYDSEGVVELIKNDKKIEVVSFKPLD